LTFVLADVREDDQERRSLYSELVFLVICLGLELDAYLLGELVVNFLRCSGVVLTVDNQVIQRAEKG